jgi:pimeloyl-ACP methyl ester carboxylesterase
LVIAYGALVVIAYLPYDEVPRAQLVKPGDEFISIHGVSVRYRRYGNPSLPALVLLHGFANSLQTWRDFAPLAAAHFHIVALDMPGYGLSDKPVRFDYGNPAQGQFVADFINQLDLTNVVVGGHSLGGAVAVHTALAAHQVVGLLLFNPGILSTGVPSATQHLFFPLQRVSARQFGSREFRAEFLRTSYIDPSIVTEAVIDDVMAGSRMEGYLQGMSSLMDQYAEGQELPLLEKIGKPTLIIWGAADRNKPIEESRQLQQRIPGSKLVVIDNVGHYVHEEAPAKAAAALARASAWLWSDGDAT